MNTVKATVVDGTLVFGATGYRSFQAIGQCATDPSFSASDRQISRTPNLRRPACHDWMWKSRSSRNWAPRHT
jgi:hypothetical protein